MEEACQLAEELAAFPIAHIYCSPLRRARMTAEAIARRDSIGISIVDSLREIGFGEWEGLDWDEVERRDASFAQLWMQRFPQLTPPGGEPYAAFKQRVESAWAEICTAVKSSSADTAAVVAHGGVVQAIQAFQLRRDFRQIPMLGTAKFARIDA
jgi:broad specificity phosphatase PhoE